MCKNKRLIRIAYIVTYYIYYCILLTLSRITHYYYIAYCILLLLTVHQNWKFSNVSSLAIIPWKEIRALTCENFMLHITYTFISRIACICEITYYIHILYCTLHIHVIFPVTYTFHITSYVYVSYCTLHIRFSQRKRRLPWYIMYLEYRIFFT